MSSNEQAAGRVRPDGMTIFFIALALVSGGAVLVLQGSTGLLEALRSAAALLLGIAPIIIVALFVGGYVEALLPREMVARWLGEDSGSSRYLFAIIAGVATPAGPFGAFPLLMALRRAGAPFDVCVVYVSAWATLGIHRIMIWELPFLGHDFVILRVLASLPVPIAAGLLARVFLARNQ